MMCRRLLSREFLCRSLRKARATPVQHHTSNRLPTPESSTHHPNMPPRVSAASLRSLRFQNTSQSFCCTQCLAHRSLARTNLRIRITALRDVRTGRHISTVTGARSFRDDADIAPLIKPTTAINKPLDVAPASKELYKALKRLGTDAANYVGVSRLGLALRSLEGRNGTIRVAVLAMDGDVERVKRLVRLLLADPLGKEEDWEKELVDAETGESVLIRCVECMMIRV